MQNKVTP